MFKSIIKGKRNNLFDFEVRWNLNHLCNLTCWFCNQNNNKTDYTEDDIKAYQETIDEVIIKMNTELKTFHNKKIRINLLGGEPTLMDLPAIIDAIEPNDNYILFKITTNYTCSQEYLDKLYTIFEDNPNKDLRINVSFHESEIDVDDMIAKIQDNKNFQHIKCIAVVVYDWESFHMYETLRELFDNRVVPQLYTNSTKHIEVPQEIIDKINFKDAEGSYTIVDMEDNEERYTRYEFLTQYNIPSFKGCNCLGASKIMMDGRVRSCQYDKPSYDNKIFETEARICPYNEYCNLCYPVRIENTNGQE